MRSLTDYGRQTDRPDGRSYRDAVVEPEQRQIVLKVQITELAQDGPQHEPGFRFSGRVAVVVFAKSHLDQRPKESAAIFTLNRF